MLFLIEDVNYNNFEIILNKEKKCKIGLEYLIIFLIKNYFYF